MSQSKSLVSRSYASVPSTLGAVLVVCVLTVIMFTGCKKEMKAMQHPPSEVSVITVQPKDTAVSIEFVGQTQSSHQVEIRARVTGFLDKCTYTEGSLVKSGDLMYKMDPKPFQAQLNAALGALSQQEARLTTARANLTRVKPLVQQNALSQKDLDDATGQEQSAAAAVESAKAQVESARLNLGYCAITSPVTGLSSYTRVQEGAYVNVQNSLLTYVAQTDPIWVNFSLSENDVLKYRGESGRGELILPKGQAFEVEVVLGDGTVYPKRGRITFADAEYNQQTGTFLVRATFPNPGTVLRPGQFVRAHVLGAIRPNAMLVPQRAVQQGGKGHFLWIVNKEGKAESRPVVVGDWSGKNWFITEGLRAGDVVVVDGGLALRPGEPVKVKDKAASMESAPIDAASKKDAGTIEAAKTHK